MKKRVLVLRLVALVALGVCAFFAVVSWATLSEPRCYIIDGPYVVTLGDGRIMIRTTPVIATRMSGSVTFTHVATVPIWPLCVVPGVVGVMCLLLSFRRPPPGFCRKCGYDLTGNVSGVCPECGAAVDVGVAQPWHAESR